MKVKQLGFLNHNATLLFFPSLTCWRGARGEVMKNPLFATRALRINMTEAEKIFWDYVRDKKFLNKKFRRQHLIKFEIDGVKRHFIADFYCFEGKLVIEIDDGIHECQKNYDEYRTYIINILGYNVIRFSNDDVLYNFEKVITELKEILNP